MPVPFRETSGDVPTAAVAYLRILKPGNGVTIQGALFVTNGGGDPLEFCCTQVEVDAGGLWPPGRVYRRAVAVLVKALFEAANHQPELVLAFAEEIPPEIFAEEIEVQIPVCLVGESGIALHWMGQKPADGSALSSQVESLRSRNLLLEPFRRAAQGLQEAFAD